ncbi:MAG: hypothetical protein QNJ46_16550 [Leptolyngbyaceae cyanobacterium MO_188.B28]|nr:hypothetical protein [Leptolyngbyaceae cyanobacterium MO_188.B28]
MRGLRRRNKPIHPSVQQRPDRTQPRSQGSSGSRRCNATVLSKNPGISHPQELIPASLICGFIDAIAPNPIPGGSQYT